MDSESLSVIAPALAVSARPPADIDHVDLTDIPSAIGLHLAARLRT